MFCPGNIEGKEGGGGSQGHALAGAQGGGDEGHAPVRVMEGTGGLGCVVAQGPGEGQRGEGSPRTVPSTSRGAGRGRYGVGSVLARGRGAVGSVLARATRGVEQSDVTARVCVRDGRP